MHIRLASKYKIRKDLYKCECGKEFMKFQSLNAHFSHCKIHRESIGKEYHKRAHEIKHEMAGWSKKSKEEIEKIRLKSGKKLKEEIEEGILAPSFLGKHHNRKSIEKIRKSRIEYIKSLDNYNGTCARFSQKACEYIEKLNKEKGWTLQHAKNGGEVCIGGYFLDGYDKENNIAFEYDESRHYYDLNRNILKLKDIIRQNEIISITNCRFFRYNEKTNQLYETKKIDIDSTIEVISEKISDLVKENKIDLSSIKSVKQTLKKNSKISYRTFNFCKKHNKELNSLIESKTNSKNTNLN